MMKLENTTLPIELRTTGVRSSLSRLRTSIQGWIRRHIIAEDPSPELSYLDHMDRIRRPESRPPTGGESIVRYSGQSECHRRLGGGPHVVRR